MWRATLNYTLYLFFTYGITALLIIDRYDVVKERTKYGLAIGGILLAIILYKLVRKIYKKLMEVLGDNSYFKAILESFTQLAPLLLVGFGIKLTEMHIGNIHFIWEWSLYSNLIAILFRINYTRVIKRYQRGLSTHGAVQTR